MSDLGLRRRSGTVGSGKTEDATPSDDPWTTTSLGVPAQRFEVVVGDEDGTTSSGGGGL